MALYTAVAERGGEGRERERGQRRHLKGVGRGRPPLWPWGAAKKVSVCTVSRKEREELGEIPPTPFLSLVFGQQLNFIDSFWLHITSFFSFPMHIRRAASNQCRMMTPSFSSVQKWVLRPK